MMGVVMKRCYFAALPVTIIGTILYWIYFASSSTSLRSLKLYSPTSTHPLDRSTSSLLIDPIAKYFINYPLNGPEYGDVFGEMGQRTQILTKLIATAESDPEENPFNHFIEQASLTMFPFIRNPDRPEAPAPLTILRKSYDTGSTGIVIPVGSKNFRYACHLIMSIRLVHHSMLPIQVAYAGDDDLPEEDREILSSLARDIEYLDVLSVLDDDSMKLDRSWAIKPFAVLASNFVQVILIDADAVFLQPPEILLTHSGYQETGTLLFHDRLLWQHAYQQRHDWWKAEMKHQQPSDALLQSLVWTEDYAEEGDSGVVVLHKGKLPVFMALLHICWQNTQAVRNDTTYKMTYGDKESWWFGLELCGVPHTFEHHYGAVIGEIREEEGEKDVCGFTIAHVDQNDKLLWYNGSLLKNKAVDNATYEIPDYWMIDAEWKKGPTKSEVSCMKGGTVRDLTEDEKDLIQRMVGIAKSIDREELLLWRP